MANFIDNLFGWNQKKDPTEKEPESFVPQQQDDGALTVAAGGAYGTYVDLAGNAKTEAELVFRYREMAQHPEVDNAIDDVVDEAIVLGEDYVVRLQADDVDGISEATKRKIEKEFEEVLYLLDFKENAFEVFKRWYVDGRLYYHVIIDEKKPKEGIKELRYVDPRKIKKVRTYEEVRKEGYTLKKTKEEFFLFNERGFGKNVGNSLSPDMTSDKGLKITKDAILHATSGITDENGQLVYSYLHKAIKSLNQLRVLEDATVIYRISRAPERRIFYIDVGNLPKIKAEQYLRDTMARHKNRVVYDSTTGEIRDDRKHMTMLEDYWFPRRDGGRGTEVDTLPAGQNLGEMTDVEYFQKKLYNALKVPSSRLDPDMGMALGRASEISRDEIQFSKFVGRLRTRFNQLFLKALEKQLILKGIILPEEWKYIARALKFDYRQDNHFTELKNLELLTGRLQAVQLMEPYIGRFYSNEWVRENMLFQDEETRKLEDKRIAAEADNPQFTPLEMKMAQHEADIAAMNMPPEEEEDDPIVGHNVDPDDEDEDDENEENLGHKTTPPPGKKNGPDEPKKPAVAKKAAKPKSK